MVIIRLILWLLNLNKLFFFKREKVRLNIVGLGLLLKLKNDSVNGGGIGK